MLLRGKAMIKSQSGSDRKLSEVEALYGNGEVIMIRPPYYSPHLNFGHKE